MAQPIIINVSPEGVTVATKASGEHDDLLKDLDATLGAALQLEELGVRWERLYEIRGPSDVLLFECYSFTSAMRWVIDYVKSHSHDEH
jgi:hypothetical protein